MMAPVPVVAPAWSSVIEILLFVTIAALWCKIFITLQDIALEKRRLKQSQAYEAAKIAEPESAKLYNSKSSAEEIIRASVMVSLRRIADAANKGKADD